MLDLIDVGYKRTKHASRSLVPLTIDTKRSLQQFSENAMLLSESIFYLLNIELEYKIKEKT